ncbi:MAG TPA: hypothetical protein VJN70_00565 [Gemmatimonadaceae bacterium]|nr:hypothetical protein [Gemmatimonadaceae bacterium]
MSHENDELESSNDRINTGPARNGDDRRLTLGNASDQARQSLHSSAPVPVSERAISQADGFA